ncbi:fructosamine/ketosamine-3-kinase [Chloropicon primus]|nr:fructosamine/ketosamine-3-kinase [Chloropicon primus]
MRMRMTRKATASPCCCCSSSSSARLGGRRRRRRRPLSAAAAVLRSSSDLPLEPLDEIKLWIDANLASRLGSVVRVSGGGGGSGWAQTHVLDLKGGGKLFAKIAKGRGKDEMFRGEYEGLNAMNGTGTVGVPRAFHYDDLYGSGKGSWILMEFVDLSGRLDQAELGLKLGLMHMADPVVASRDDEDEDEDEDEEESRPFGFFVDNSIGATPQPNDWTADWVEFYREKRLWHQLKLTGDTKLLRLGETALERLDEVFSPVAGSVRPSILHGDLWSGNVAADRAGNPVIYDPACYYGHHEAEFGMSWCASFTDRFWGAYEDVVPKEPAGYGERRQLYQLYHYLNHYNLFGGSYYYTCETILKQFN